MEEFFQSSDWYSALTLQERVVLCHGSTKKLDHKLAEKRLKRWRLQAPFNSDNELARRLELDKLSEDEFYRLLGQPLRTFQEQSESVPLWLQRLEKAYRRKERDKKFSLKNFVLYAQTSELQQIKEPSSVELLYVIEPLLYDAWCRLQQRVKQHKRQFSRLPYDTEKLHDIFLTNLLRPMVWRLSRTMALELNVARLQNDLQGNTPEERFKDFIKKLQSLDTAHGFFEEYAVLARQLTIYLDQWLNFLGEFLGHLCQDWQTLQASFELDESDTLVALESGLGDNHRKGRSVLIAQFSSGFQLVYKPKSLAVDVHFQTLLTWLNERGAHPPFKTLKVIDRGHYGWVEYVESHPCQVQAEVRRFYQRQGAYLALLYILEATDFHFENLIAAGEHPVMVDLEALFHPQLSYANDGLAGHVASGALYDSVLRVGLLPQRLWGNAGQEGIDISGLGALSGQLTPYAVPQWEDSGRDTMRLIRKQIELPSAHNRPRLQDEDISPIDYTKEILVGFDNLYNTLLKYKDVLLSPQGPLARFKQDEIRVILRATRTYGILLQESFHPDVLRDALERDLLFDRLWLVLHQRPYLAQIIEAERRDLLRGDIPIFTSQPQSRDIYDSEGKRIADFFEASSWDLVQRRLQGLSHADLAKQRWFITASLSTVMMSEHSDHESHYQLKSGGKQAKPAELIEAAKIIGERLTRLALLGKDDAAWLGLSLTGQKHWSLLPLGEDLYSGLPGVCLFLAYLGELTGETSFTQLARAGLKSLRMHTKDPQAYQHTIGAFSGWGGFIYVLLHLAVLWREEALLKEAEATLAFLPELIEKDRTFDIIGGTAGCLATLLRLYDHHANEATLAIAIQCGDHLIKHAQTMSQGMAWLPGDQGPPLTGFSHGAAGIAWSLLELYCFRKEQRFKDQAYQALAYERSLFSPVRENWPDLRKSRMGQKDEVMFMNAWCHGAPGIGLGRLNMFKHVPDESLLKEVEQALETTLQGFGRGHSLCHGDLGNIELLLQVSLRLKDSKLHAETYSLASAILNSIEQEGCMCGVPLGVETPGLMTGLAGIGYQLLRLADPKRVPSVLSLEGPFTP